MNESFAVTLFDWQNIPWFSYIPHKTQIMWHTLGPGVSFSAAKRLCRVLGTELYDKEASRGRGLICFSDSIRIMIEFILHPM